MQDILTDPKRQKKLESMYRYSSYKVVFYRTNLWLHSKRVSWIVEELCPIAEKTLESFDAKKAVALALVHDDAEVITGDVQLGPKLSMTRDELARLDEEEREAIDVLAEKYPVDVNGYSYKALLLHALGKDCIEAQVVSFADKLDAYGESLHEILAGNITLLRSLLTYEKLLKNFDRKFPALSMFLDYKDSPLTYFEKRRYPIEYKNEMYEHLNKPHTKESIVLETDFSFYDRWRELTVEHWGEEGVKALTEQKEFL